MVESFSLDIRKGFMEEVVFALSSKGWVGNAGF